MRGTDRTVGCCLERTDRTVFAPRLLTVALYAGLRVSSPSARPASAPGWVRRGQGGRTTAQTAEVLRPGRARCWRTFACAPCRALDVRRRDYRLAGTETTAETGPQQPPRRCSARRQASGCLSSSSTESSSEARAIEDIGAVVCGQLCPGAGAKLQAFQAVPRPFQGSRESVTIAVRCRRLRGRRRSHLSSQARDRAAAACWRNLEEKGPS